MTSTDRFMNAKVLPLAAAAFAVITFGLVGCKNQPMDPAQGRKPENFPELEVDVFKPMDGGIALKPNEIKGRNTWNLWTGGDEQFWDRMAREGYGLIDLLKTIDSRQRGSRFKDKGLINEPGFKQASKPDQYGLWIDEAEVPEPAGIDPKVYGRPSGIMGYRIFDNPDFNEEAKKKWDGARFYTDRDYAADSNLIRPYRVGVSCGACHIAFNPCKPPEDPENPKWTNLCSAIGNQYIREGQAFASGVKDGGFFAEMLKTQPPGTSDTSRIAQDHLNNPNTINAIFELNARLNMTTPEELAGESLLLPLTGRTTNVPHVLKDGADSVGVAGATLRVYVNIGMFSQHWLEQHNALIGLRPQKPFSIELAQKNSVYWMATQQKFANVLEFFKRLKSFRLQDAPGGTDYITKDEAVMTRGKIVFAENCAKCHSSKRPPAGAVAEEWFRQEVVKPDFLTDNFLSDEKRYPITKIESNAARACGTNAKKGHIWENFSSVTYKAQPSVGEIDVWNPYTEQNQKWTVPDGGPGYYRTPSLVCIWSSAPFLHNNSLGKFTGDPSVAGRMEAFNDAAQKLLWPEKREGTNSIWRTTKECAVQIQLSVMPKVLQVALKGLSDADGYFRLGPIPQGTPINLIANIDPDADPLQLAEVCLKVKKALIEIKAKNLDAAAAKELMRNEVAPGLFKVSKCPDFVEDRGHYFGTDLPDPDKLALIEFLKTF